MWISVSHFKPGGVTAEQTELAGLEVTARVGSSVTAVQPQKGMHGEDLVELLSGEPKANSPLRRCPGH